MLGHLIMIDSKRYKFQYYMYYMKYYLQILIKQTRLIIQ
jgi:hypothetical protein